MSVLHQMLGRCAVSQNLLTSRGWLLGQQVRFRKRKANEKLMKPDDKSAVILGKVKRTDVPSIIGVSDKQYPILMQWSKPQRMETCNPAISGDIGGIEHFGEVDRSQPPLELEGSEALKDVEEEVRKILSLEFSRNKDVINKLRRGVVKSVQRHKLDENSLEVKIATLTVKIRNYQKILIDLYPYKNQPLKHDLTYKIAMRRKLIDLLREQDYRKYEWLLERLNLFYKPVPKYDHVEISRKASIERLTDLWCDELKKHRIEKYKRALQEEQPKFLRNKAEKLKHIMNEEKDLGLEQTVFQSDVDECLVRAEEIEKTLEDLESIPDTYLLYEEEVEKEQTFIN